MSTKFVKLTSIVVIVLLLSSFDYSLDFKNIDFREHPELYRVGQGEQGVLLVEPYKSETCRIGDLRLLPSHASQRAGFARCSSTHAEIDHP